MTSPIPVTIVTGFLGAGKSTLVERWLSELPSDTAVIVNEAGTVGIDGELLAERATRLREITGGCVCCVTHVELDRTQRCVVLRDQTLQRALTLPRRMHVDDLLVGAHHRAVL